MTLRDVSEATGLSPSYLSKLESGKVGVSVVNLDKIVNAIGLSGIELVISESDPEDSTSWVTRADHRTRIVVEDGVMYEEVTPRISKFGLSAILFRCQPGESSGEVTTHKGDEFRYVVKGKFRFCMDDEEFVLHTGDTISHPSSVPHCWKNVGSEEGVFLVVSTLPSIDVP
jgi:quercetin dioxygenase-like cupin family protein